MDLLVISTHTRTRRVTLAKQRPQSSRIISTHTRTRRVTASRGWIRNHAKFQLTPVRDG